MCKMRRCEIRIKCDLPVQACVHSAPFRCNSRGSSNRAYEPSCTLHPELGDVTVTNLDGHRVTSPVSSLHNSTVLYVTPVQTCNSDPHSFLFSPLLFSFSSFFDLNCGGRRTEIMELFGLGLMSA